MTQIQYLFLHWKIVQFNGSRNACLSRICIFMYCILFPPQRKLYYIMGLFWWREFDIICSRHALLEQLVVCAAAFDLNTCHHMHTRTHSANKAQQFHPSYDLYVCILYCIYYLFKYLAYPISRIWEFSLSLSLFITFFWFLLFLLDCKLRICCLLKCCPRERNPTTTGKTTKITMTIFLSFSRSLPLSLSLFSHGKRSFLFAYSIVYIYYILQFKSTQSNGN